MDRQAAVCVACMQKLSAAGKNGLAGFGPAGQLDLIKELIIAFQPSAEDLQPSANYYSSASKAVTRNQICPNCGFEFEQYHKEGRFGCSVCYDTFKQRITPMVQEIHECVRHNGSRPANSLGDGK